jgi:ABC-type polysaccharide/polyol phosphate transport system ATPase subunit
VSTLVRANGAGVRFQFDRQRRVVTPAMARLRRAGRTVWGLRGVTLEIGPGEGVALVGPSGSGKTSLLRLVAGVLTPDEGALDVEGRVGSLLAVQAGLMTRLTGRENATLLGVLAGMSTDATRDSLEAIKERSGLEEAFERPVSSYSLGMRARLGFAVADCRHVDVLALDEVHDALDHEFREVVAQRAEAIRRRGGIVIAAGHDHPLLHRLCERAIHLEAGTVADDGPFERVRERYLSSV